MHKSLSEKGTPPGSRLVAVMFKHETNTFAPFATRWEAFGVEGPVAGEAAIEGTRGTNQALAAFIDFASTTHAVLTVPLCGRATPGGIVDRASFERAWSWVHASLNPAPDTI